jgi:tRNA threonylcarbamoyladenosine biosynthesis protein TsaB
MNLLAIDASTDTLTLAILANGQRFHYAEKVGNQHSEHILPQIRQLLTAANLELAALDAIVFGQGPGGFTGLRISCAVAQGLAYVHQLPIIAIPSLDAVAAQTQAERVFVCMDARMSEVFWACYENGIRISPLAVNKPADIELSGALAGAWQSIGTGYTPYQTLFTPQALQALAATTLVATPCANRLIDLALTGRYPSIRAEEADLLYVRNNVAMTLLEQQEAKRKPAHDAPTQ